MPTSCEKHDCMGNVMRSRNASSRINALPRPWPTDGGGRRWSVKISPTLTDMDVLVCLASSAPAAVITLSMQTLRQRNRNQHRKLLTLPAQSERWKYCAYAVKACV